MANEKMFEKKYSMAQIGVLADVFGKSLLTIQRWIAKSDDRLESDKARTALKKIK